MKKIYVTCGDIISSLGINAGQNFDLLEKNITGIKSVSNSIFSRDELYASFVDNEKLDNAFSNIFINSISSSNLTKLEKMMMLVLKDLLNKTKINVKSKRTGLIISTTKGNIDLLSNDNVNNPVHRILLYELANFIASSLNFENQPFIVSNACISGLLAIIMAGRLINTGVYDNIFVVGGDIISKFVVSGFQSFKSLSSLPCKPFDKERDGLSLGEGAGCLLLSNSEKNSLDYSILYKGGASTNDANHISGPSPTGEGLFMAIQNAQKATNNLKIDYISAHGTATNYNDDMESYAINRAGLENIPVNSFKGYWGHTLGAAGIVETIAGLNSMCKNRIYATKGCSETGLAKNINVTVNNLNIEIKNMLKLASGFGGCNAAAIFSKEN